MPSNRVGHSYSSSSVSLAPSSFMGIFDGICDLCCPIFLGTRGGNEFEWAAR